MCRLRPARCRTGSSRALEMVGQDAVFDRAEQRSDHRRTEQRHEQQHSEWTAKPTTATRGDADLGEFQPLRHQRLVVAVGEFAAEAGEEEERRDQRRAGKRDQRLGIRRPPIWNRIRKTSAVLRKLSPNAEKNWHQNNGAKRRVVIRDMDMDAPPLALRRLAGECPKRQSNRCRAAWRRSSRLSN